METSTLIDLLEQLEEYAITNEQNSDGTVMFHKAQYYKGRSEAFRDCIEIIKHKLGEHDLTGFKTSKLQGDHSC